VSAETLQLQQKEAEISGEETKRKDKDLLGQDVKPGYASKEEEPEARI